MSRCFCWISLLAFSLWSAAQAQDLAYISNVADNSVSVIATATNTVQATIRVGDGPTGVVVTPDGRKAYVTTQAANSVSVIDAATGLVTASIAVGTNPLGAAVTPDGSKLYVANTADPGTISVIATATDTVTATITVGNGAQGVAVSPDGSTLYVTNRDDGTVSIIATATDTVSAVVAVGSFPTSVAVTPDGTAAYVTNTSGNSVSVIATATDAVTTTIPVGNGPLGVAITPDGRKAYVPNQADNSVAVINTATNKVATSIPVGTNPLGVALTTDGSKAYVANFQSNTVSVIATATDTVLATVGVGNNPNPLGKFVGPIPAPTAVAALTALENLFVVQQQYFILDAEDTVNPQANHLHITELNTATGNFTGAIWSPLVPPGFIPAAVVPVSGTIKAVPATVNMNVSFGPSEYYPITFTWDFDTAAFGCQTENASYTGAISLLGYQGSGKMHGVIAGTVTANYGTCELGGFSMGPLPFSGILTK